MIDEKVLISVVIPVYNVELYLERCLDSICNNTYKNLQIICINDGSTDNSIVILRNFAKKDNRIEIIEKRMQEYLQLEMMELKQQEEIILHLLMLMIGFIVNILNI